VWSGGRSGGRSRQSFFFLQIQISNKSPGKFEMGQNKHLITIDSTSSLRAFFL